VPFASVLPPTEGSTAVPRSRASDRRLLRVLAAFGLFAVVEYGVWFAVILYAYDVGGVGLAGLVGVAQLVPAALLAPALGSLGDRLPRGAALCGAYAVEAALLALVAALLQAEAPVALVVTASALTTTTVSVGRPIHYAALPSLARTPAALVRGNSVSGVLDGLGIFVGPVIAGVLSARSGPAAALGLAAVVMALAALLALRLRLPVAAADSDEGALSAAIAGLRVVATDPPVLVLLLLLGVGFLVSGAVEILAVSYALEVLGDGEGAAGLLAGASGIGGLLGAALAAGLAHRSRLVPAVVLGLGLAAVPLALVGQVELLAAGILLLAVVGVGEALTGVAGRTLLQRVTDDEVLARVFAVQEAVMLVGLALGAALAPLLVAARGAAGGFLPLAVGLAAAALASWVVLRGLDARARVRLDVTAALRRVPFLAAMAPPDLERLVQRAGRVDEPLGTVVIRQGDRGDAFYVVESGSLAVDVDGVRRSTPLGAGDGFGEIALLQDVPRTATITAVSDVVLLRIERDDFLAAVTGSPDGHLLADEVTRAHLRRDASTD
jgi:MFS family permease